MNHNLDKIPNYHFLITKAFLYQAAEGEKARVEGFGKKTEAEPTIAHFALSAMVTIIIVIILRIRQSYFLS